MAKRKPDPTLTGPQALTWPAVGETLEVFANPGRYRGRAIPGESIGAYTVQGPCEHPNAGHWYCVTHRLHFTNQFEKDIHIGHGQHQLVWCCDLHGLEVSPNWAKP